MQAALDLWQPYNGGVDGETLKQARLRLGLTLEEVARRAHVSAATVSRVETGAVRGNWHTVRAIADVLGVEMEKPRRVERQPLPTLLRRAAAELEGTASGTSSDARDPTVEHLPDEVVQVRLVDSVVGAGDGPIPSDAEYVGFAPPSNLRGHTFVAVRVRGNCLAPKISDGEIVIVDRDLELADGDIAALQIDSEEVLRLYAGGRFVSFNTHPPITPDEHTRVVGIVVAAVRTFR